MYNQKAYSALAAFLSSGRLPHAILLEGIKGTGKTTLAQEIAMGALCGNNEHAQPPCGLCKDCVKVGKGIHPDVLYYSGEGGSRSFHVDIVRQLRQDAYVRPNEGRCKVLILKDVHNMTVQAENALLKIIEEPPSNVYFILTCENKASLLDTILSRVTVIELAVPTRQQCEQALPLLKPGLSEAQYHQAAMSASSIGGALELLAESADTENAGQALALLEGICLGSELDTLAGLSAYEKDPQGFLGMMSLSAALVRQLLSSAQAENTAYRKLKERLSPLQLVQILAIIEETAEAVPRNINKLLLITNLSAKIKLALSK